MTQILLALRAQQIVDPHWRRCVLEEHEQQQASGQQQEPPAAPLFMASRAKELSAKLKQEFGLLEELA